MKKTVKSLIIAASVAAIAGIGAVSFAKWESTVSDQTVDGTLGNIETTGTITLTQTGDLDKKVLVPHDQEQQWDAETMTKGFTVSASCSLDGQIQMTATGDAATLIEYQKAGDTTWTAFTAAAVDVDADTVYSFRLVSNDTNDMDKTFTITYSFVADTATGA
ncbi:MAG: hypothetical protein K2F90_06265 [Clostridiales bacterium]|nr:hypothetical protein [Clostridiales bacterium]